MKQDQFQAEVLARLELLEQRLSQTDKAIRDLQDRVVDLASAFARAGIHLEEKTG